MDRDVAISMNTALTNIKNILNTLATNTTSTTDTRSISVDSERSILVEEPVEEPETRDKK